MSRRLARRRVVAASLAAAVAGAGLVASWHSARTRDARRLAEAVAALDAAEPGWRAPESAGPPLPPPERNAARVAVAAVANLPPSYRAWEAREFFRPGDPPGAGIDGGDLASALAAHADCSAAFAFIAPLRDLTGGGVAWPLDTLGAPAPPELFALRDALGLLRLDALVQAHRRRPAEGASACVRLFNLAGGGYGDAPSSSAQFGRAWVAGAAVAETERLLAWNELADADLAELQARCAQERGVPRLARLYRGYRAVLARHLDAIDSGAVSVWELSPATTPSRLDRALANNAPAGARGEVARARLQNLEYFAALIAAESRPDPERATAAIRAPVPAAAPTGPPTAEGYAAVMWRFARDAAVADANLRAYLACAEVAIACERFRLRSGRFPGALAEIPPELLAAVPADPYTGSPVIYRPTAGGATVYSVGPDLLDHGGREVVGTMTHTDRAGRDLGFRLVNSPLRRAAPPPEPEVPSP